MRGHLAGVIAAVFSAAALTSLVFVGSAFAVTITSFTPTSGLPNKDNGTACPGGVIAISGSGFTNDGPSASVKVAFNGLQSPLVQIGSDTTVYSMVPDGATTGPITVTTATGSATSAATFYVNPCPQVSLTKALGGTSVTGYLSTPSVYKVKPASGKVGTAITITGTSLLGVTGVSFGTAKATFKASSATQITTTVPKGAVTGPITLTYSISASTTQGGIVPTNTAGNSSLKVATYETAKKFKVTK